MRKISKNLTPTPLLAVRYRSLGEGLPKPAFAGWGDDGLQPRLELRNPPSRVERNSRNLRVCEGEETLG